MARIHPGNILLLIAISLLFLANPATADIWQDYKNQCHQKAPSMVTAIEQFCSRGNIQVPSNYASQGVMVPPNHVQIHVVDACIEDGRLTAKNPVWIPSVWCKRQFFETCAKGASNGWAHRVFGFKGCQDFWTN